MLEKKRIIVVGTTADYVELLDARFPERVLFITDPHERKNWNGVHPKRENEVICQLDDYDAVSAALNYHIQSHSFQFNGIVCFDCESMRLTARLAESNGLVFPSEQAVLRCRSKYSSKKIWLEKGVPCPNCDLVRHEEDALKFFDSSSGNPVVFKPLTGSGSELVFLCTDRQCCSQAYHCIQEHLENHPNKRMYGAESIGEDLSHQNAVAVEDYIGGEEFSCDFSLENNEVTIIRLSKKIPYKESCFGTILAYQMVTHLPNGFEEETLCGYLKDAAQSLGIDRTLAMVDFKIDRGRLYFLELTPRPGGDCLPPLIEMSCGFDIFQAALDFAEGKKFNVPSRKEWEPLVGLQLFASQAGIIQKLDVDFLFKDQRVVTHYLKRQEGDRVRLPPEDYDSRSLGWVIFKPSGKKTIEAECAEIVKNFDIEIG